MSSLSLTHLYVEYFGAIQRAEVQFGSGLNILYGPNDLGKSTLAASIRCALLTPAKSKQASRWQSWSSEVPPTVRLTFNSGRTQYRVEKTFHTKRGTATLEEFQGDTFTQIAKQSNVDPHLRELLSWGLPISNRKAPISFTTVSLLGEQAQASQVFEVGFDIEDEGATKDALAKAVGSLTNSPEIERVLSVARKQVNAHFDSTGKHRGGQQAPLRPYRDAVTASELTLQEATKLFEAKQELEVKLKVLSEALEEGQRTMLDLSKEVSALTEKSNDHTKLLRQLAQLNDSHESLTKQKHVLETTQEEHSSQKIALDELTTQQRTLEKTLADITSRQEEDRLAQQRQVLRDEQRKQLVAEHALLSQQVDNLIKLRLRTTNATKKSNDVLTELDSGRELLERNREEMETAQRHTTKAQLSLLQAQYWSNSNLLNRAKAAGERLEDLNAQHAAKTRTSQLSPAPTTLQTIQAIRLEERRYVLLDIRKQLKDLSTDSAHILDEWIERTSKEWNEPSNQVIRSVLPPTPANADTAWLALLGGGSIADLEAQIDEAERTYSAHDSTQRRLRFVAEEIHDLGGTLAETAPEQDEDVYQKQYDAVLKTLSTHTSRYEHSEKQVTVLDAQLRLAREHQTQVEADLGQALALLKSNEDAKKTIARQKARLQLLQLEIQKFSDDAKATGSSQKVDIETAKKQLDAVRNTVSSAKKRYDELTGRLRAAEERFSPEDLLQSTAALDLVKQQLLPLAKCKEQLETKEKTLSILRQTLQSQQQELDRTEGALAARKAAGDINESRIVQLRRSHEWALSRESEAIEDAMGWKKLLAAAEEVAQESNTGLAELMGTELSHRFSELIQFVARDELNYGSVVFNQASPSVESAGESRTLNSFSVGVREQLATILRLIVAEKLQNTLILDDQLTQTDTHRLQWFSRLLRQVSKKTQIIVLTCREHEYHLDNRADGAEMIDLEVSISRV